MCIGERPTEVREGIRPFTGDVGREFNDNYLPLAGLNRDEIYFTNTVKCSSTNKNDKPTDKEIQTCSSYWLPVEVEAVQPEIIIPMGATACQLFGGFDLELEHGIPRLVKDVAILGGWSGWVVPMYHPASGMHDTKNMIPLLEDWEKLGLWLKGKWTPPDTSTIKPIYQWLETEADVHQVFQTAPELYYHLPVDTESQESRPFSIQFSTAPGQAYMFRTEKPLVDAFALHLKWSYDNRVLLHNAIYDLDELEQSGIGDLMCRDTMQEAYHLGNLPQGLKPLTFRLTGVRMRSYADIVEPASRRALEDWLADAYEYSVDNMREVEIKQLKTKTKEIEKPSAAEKAIQRLLRHVPNATYDPWTRIEDADWLPTLESIVGRFPRKGIANCNRADALAYGCADADMSGRVGTALELERARIVANEWRID